MQATAPSAPLAQTVLTVLRAWGYQRHLGTFLSSSDGLAMVAWLAVVGAAYQHDPVFAPVVDSLVMTATTQHLFATTTATREWQIESVAGRLHLGTYTPETLPDPAEVRDRVAHFLEDPTRPDPFLERRLATYRTPSHASAPATSAFPDDALAMLAPPMPRIPWWQRLVQRVWRGGAV